jgi:hypothetical protein
MRLASEIELRPYAAEPGQEQQSEILIGGRLTASVVSGHVLEAAVEYPAGWLLFITDDIPYEETLAIHLLDMHGRLRDSACIGSPYATGIFTSLRLDPPRTVRFRFIGDIDWFVRILEKPRRCLPWWPDVRGVWRGRRFWRHFEIGRAAV